MKDIGVEYKPIKDFEGKYEVSEAGKVWSVRREVHVKQYLSNSGYYYVVLCDKFQSNKVVHRLVAAAFIGNIKRKKVNFIDNDRSNAHRTNLQIGGLIGDNGKRSKYPKYN